MSLFNELKRRNVFRVTAAYVVISWLLLQVGDVVFEALEVDASANRLLMALVLLGLIPTVLFAWAFEMTPEGIKRDKDVLSNEQQDRQKAKKLDYITMGVLFLVGAMSLWQHWRPSENQTDADQGILPLQNVVEDLRTNDSQEAKVDEKSLAVLPFMNITSSSESQPFTDGIHDDLITHLSKISALKVISRTSVLRYLDSGLSLKKIAKELGVANILEGGVQRSGNQIRLNVKLIDAQSDQQLWAQVFDRELSADNIFNIQTEIAEQIAVALRAQLSDADLLSLNKHQTNNLDAYNAYLAGRQRLLVRNSHSLKEALALFEKAAELDPDYALAYVGQADTWSLLNSYSDVTENDMFEFGEAAVEKALSLDPLLAEAHTSKANYLKQKNQFEAAENRFEYSIKLNPNYATTYHWYGLLADSMGQSEKSLMLSQKAASLDPLSPVIQSNLGFQFVESKQYEAAQQQFDRIIELAPEYSGAATGKSLIYAEQGNLAESIRWQKKAIEIDSGNLSIRVNLANLFIDIGLIEQAKAEIFSIQKESPGYEGLIYVQANLDMFEYNYQQAADRFAGKVVAEPRNLSYVGNWSFYQMLLKNYDVAIDSILEVYTGKKSEAYNVNTNNFDSTINLIWMWQQVGETDNANELLNQLKQFIAEYPKYDSIYKQAMIAAAEGRHLDALNLFGQQFQSGDSRGLWRGRHLLMLKPVIELPQSKQIFTQYSEMIAKQRTEVLAML